MTRYKRYLTLAACVVYVLSPIDIMPEAFLGPFGLADDAIAVIIAIKQLFKGNRHGQ